LLVVGIDADLGHSIGKRFGWKGDDQEMYGKEIKPDENRFFWISRRTSLALAAY